jgi:ferrous iron transport protein A
MRGRLFDLGLAPGTRVVCAHRNHSGDLTAYVIRGAVIALRREDAESVTVR